MIDGELAVFQPNLPTKQSTALRCALCCYKVRNYCTLYPYAVRYLFQTVASENQWTANNSHSGGPGAVAPTAAAAPAPPLPPERATAQPVWFLGDPNYRVL